MGALSQKFKCSQCSVYYIKQEENIFQDLMYFPYNERTLQAYCENNKSNLLKGNIIIVLIIVSHQWVVVIDSSLVPH